MQFYTPKCNFIPRLLSPAEDVEMQIIIIFRGQKFAFVADKKSR